MKTNAFLKKIKGLQKLEIYEIVKTLTINELVEILVDVSSEINGVDFTSNDNRFPITQAEFDRYFRIKESKGRGRKRREKLIEHYAKSDANNSANN